MGAVVEGPITFRVGGELTVRMRRDLGEGFERVDITLMNGEHDVFVITGNLETIRSLTAAISDALFEVLVGLEEARAAGDPDRRLSAMVRRQGG